MINADVVVENKSWNKKIKDPNNYIKKKIKKIYKFNSLKKKHFSLTILLTDNSKMKYLNKKFRNKSKTTDVLSFPNLDTVDLKKKTNTEIYLGDIALSYEIINRRSKIVTLIWNLIKCGFTGIYICWDMIIKKLEIIK